MAGSSTIASSRRGLNSSLPMRRTWFTILLCWLFAALPVAVFAASVDELLARPEAPHGVIFEIVDGDEQALRERLPVVRAAIEKLRQRFPQTEFAIVSHGREQFALQSLYHDEQAEIHAQVRSLVDDTVPVHVCGTHAGWYGVGAEDFPEYVDVAPSGPAQIALYRELGYELIVVE